MRTRSGVVVIVLAMLLATDSVAEEAQMNAGRVKRDNGRVWIEGVPVLTWSKSVQTTFVGALTAATQAMGASQDHHDLMGASGLAFRVRWWRGGEQQPWCPSSPVGEMPPWSEYALSAAGWSARSAVYFDEPDAGQRIAAHEDELVAAIDAGRPVLAYMNDMNVSVVYGYKGDAAPRRFLVRDYFKGEQELLMPLVDTKGMLWFLHEPVPPAPREQLAINALKLAVEDWQRPRAGQGERGGYLFGEAAYAQWIKDLREASAMPEEMRKKLLQPSWWTLCVLSCARSSAREYLRRIAPEFDGEAKAELEQAAACYERSAAIASRTFATKDVFLGPWTGKGLEGWTDAVREDEAALLEQLRASDAEGIGHIERALKATQ